MSLRSRLDDERGLAMVIALMVSLVVLLLAAAVVAQSISNLGESGYDRRRLLSVNAAEAGTNYWYKYLQTSPAALLDCGAKIVNVASGPPVAKFTASATFYNATKVVMPCSGVGTFSDATYPSYALIQSTGTVNGQAPRTMETYMRLTPNYGGFGAAILAIDGATFENNFDVYGNANSGDIYILDGDLLIENQIVVNGNLYVPLGGLHMENNSEIKGNAWARDDVEIVNPAKVDGYVLSSTGDIFGTGAIISSATAFGTVNDTTLTIGGIVSEGIDVGDVPTQEFPQIGWNTTDWTDVGHTVVTFTGSGTAPCTNAYNWIRSSWASSGFTDVVVRIDATCTFTPGNVNINVRGSLGIISDGGFDLDKADWTGSGTSLPHKLRFISTYETSCPNGSTNNDIFVGNNADFTNVQVLFYTPCSAHMDNQSNFSGQVLAKSVDIENNYKMSYVPVLVPGYDGITGFKQDISYVREVANP